MNYQITFRNKTTISVDEYQGDTIKQIIMSGKNLPFEINGNVYKTVDITAIEKTHDTPSPPLAAYIESGRQCRSKRSIQREVNNIIMDQHKNWTTVIRDKSVREQIRLGLRDIDNGWCDYRDNECVC